MHASWTVCDMWFRFCLLLNDSKMVKNTHNLTQLKQPLRPFQFLIILQIEYFDDFLHKWCYTILEDMGKISAKSLYRFLRNIGFILLVSLQLYWCLKTSEKMTLLLYLRNRVNLIISSQGHFINCIIICNAQL